MEIDTLLRRADQAIGTGDLKQATNLLEEAAQLRSTDHTLWLRVAAMHRARGGLPEALNAVHRALAIMPLDFMALLMRASLLQRIGDPQAGEAWGHALAQKPAGELPSQLAATLSEGERHHAAWLDVREQRMARATVDAEARATEEARARIARFRTNALRKTRPFHSEPTHFHYPGDAMTDELICLHSFATDNLSQTPGFLLISPGENCRFSRITRRTFDQIPVYPQWKICRCVRSLLQR